MTTIAGVSLAKRQAAPILTADGTPLAKRLAYVSRRAKLRAFLLVAPLLLFVLTLFVVPIFQVLGSSASNTVIPSALHRMTQKLATWSGPEAPGEDVYEALVQDLIEVRKSDTPGRILDQVNHVYSGARSLFSTASRNAATLEKPFKKSMIELDEKWGDPVLWRMLKALGAPVTPIYYLNAVDATLDGQGSIVPVPEEIRVHNQIALRTFWLSMLVTVLCFVLGYPIAFLLAQLPMRISNLLMICVLLPFWTALLVRITAWIALLQSDGVVLSSLASLGVVALDTKDRPQLIYNLVGTLVAMVHVLLPSMVLPLYSVMKTVPPSYVRAARSLGATPWTAFWRVYFPQTIPGISAGALLVFILSVGYYITPALLGGSSGVLISNFIADYQNRLYWGHAAALAALLLAAVLVLYWLFNRIVGIDRLKMG